ncbi:MAG: hypothetical protein IKB39_06325 [Bacteroidaceae bacterium]|nr:hypothetical protein [Bacteroidaceae bacterium]
MQFTDNPVVGFSLTANGDYYVISNGSYKVSCCPGYNKGQTVRWLSGAEAASQHLTFALVENGLSTFATQVEAANAAITEHLSASFSFNYISGADATNTWSEASVYPAGLSNDVACAGGKGNSAQHIGASGHTVHKATTAVAAVGGQLTVTIQYNSELGNHSHAISILGVDAVNGNGEVVASDYHYGFSGTDSYSNTYTLDNLAAGNYILRYYVCDKSGDHDLNNTSGTITVSGAKEIAVVAEVENMLTSLKSNIETYVIPFKGDGLGYYSTSEVAAIETKMGAEVGETVAAQTAAFVALDDAVDALSPLVPDGTFIRIKNNGDTGYLVSGTGTGLTQFEAVATAATTANSVFYYTNGKLLSFKNGMYIATNGSKLTYTNTVGEAAGTTINFEVSQVAGKVQMSFMNGNNVRYFYSNGTGDSNAGDIKVKFTTTYPDYRFTIEEVETLPVTIGESGYATFYSPVAVTLPAGLEAYCVSSTTSTSASMTKIESGVVPAETAVILNGAAGAYNLTIGGTASAIGTNVLEGTVASAYITEDAYVLSAPAGEAGFYKATKNQSENTAFLNNGFKAYLPAAGGEARFLSFDFGTETAIESIEGENGNVKAEIYDLAGRRVQNAQKGLYIVNGKKVVK